MDNNFLYNENELLRRIAEGDTRSFEEIVIRYKNKLHAFVLNMTRSVEATEEIVQDSFLQVWITREGLPEVENFGNYLFILCRNRCLNALRKQLSDRRRQHALEQGLLRAPDPEPAFSFELLIAEVQRAVNQLPPQQKRAWELSRRQGKNYGEIALEMALSKETVRKHVQLANISIIAFLKARKDLLLWIAWLIYEN